MFQKIAKHRANDASNDVHRPPLTRGPNRPPLIQKRDVTNTGHQLTSFDPKT